jgi:hypothetical protein
MKTTVDLPDELFRKAKAAAALRGIKFKDLVQEALVRVLDLESTEVEAKPQKTLYDRIKGSCGIYSSGIPDLATNPEHMADFGHD